MDWLKDEFVTENKCRGCKKPLDYIDCAAVHTSYLEDLDGVKSEIKVELICPDCFYVRPEPQREGESE